MARRKTSKGQINHGKKQVFKALTNLMEDMGQKYSIKVGIIGSDAYEQHPHADLTNAQLGAIHEFGATINVTDKMRAYLHYNGIHLRKDTAQVVIPARSFLRSTLLSNEGKEQIMAHVRLDTGTDENSRELNKLLVEERIAQGNSNFMETLAKVIAAKAVSLVKDAFTVGGWPNKWEPVSEYTIAHRYGNPDGQPLTDTGELRNSISSEVIKHG